jgi:hypothetical protein
MREFRENLERIINECSLESGSDTPDFILADYLEKCLRIFDETLCRREAWYGRQVSGDSENAQMPIAATSGEEE